MDRKEQSTTIYQRYIEELSFVLITTDLSEFQRIINKNSQDLSILFASLSNPIATPSMHIQILNCIHERIKLEYHNNKRWFVEMYGRCMAISKTKLKTYPENEIVNFIKFCTFHKFYAVKYLTKESSFREIFPYSSYSVTLPQLLMTKKTKGFLEGFINNPNTPSDILEWTFTKCLEEIKNNRFFDYHTNPKSICLSLVTHPNFKDEFIIKSLRNINFNEHQDFILELSKHIKCEKQKELTTLLY